MLCIEFCPSWEYFSNWFSDLTEVEVGEAAYWRWIAAAQEELELYEYEEVEPARDRNTADGWHRLQACYQHEHGAHFVLYAYGPELKEATPLLMDVEKIALDTVIREFAPAFSWDDV